MALCVLSCGIFQPELERMLPEVLRELNLSTEVEYVPPALHVDYKKLADGISGGLENFKGRDVVLLFGSMCHPKMPELAAGSRAPYFKEGNCIDVLLSPERKRELEKYGKVFYMTAGWLKYWRDIFQAGMSWDPIDARINMGFYNQVVVLDSGVCEISDEDLLEFFEFTQVPVEVEPITLEHFKKKLTDIFGGA
ncbi:MAG: DUF1638 domain-containing protein [Synergistaceae bacterium]|jgi:hypothetical protein|nr:DUF1638 domain-containing protein [Synergistaceae bacterium]